MTYKDVNKDINMLPQDTDIGKAFVIDKTKFREFTLGDKKNYGIDTVKDLYIITGKTYEEKALPVLKFPYLIDDKLVVDMRDVIRHPEKDNLKDMLNLRSDYRYKLLLAALTDEEAIGGLREHYKLYSKTLQILINGQLKSQLMLDNSDLMIVNNIVAIYAYNIMNETKGYSGFHVASTSVIGDVMNENDIHEMIGDNDLVTLQDVLDIFKNDRCSITLRKLEGDVLHSMLSSMVFQSHRLHFLIGLRSPVTMLALLWLYDNERLYQKTMLKNTLKNFAKMLDTPKLSVDMKLLVKKKNLNDLF